MKESRPAASTPARPPRDSPAAERRDGRLPAMNPGRAFVSPRRIAASRAAPRAMRAVASIPARRDALGPRAHRKPSIVSAQAPTRGGFASLSAVKPPSTGGACRRRGRFTAVGEGNTTRVPLMAVRGGFAAQPPAGSARSPPPARPAAKGMRSPPARGRRRAVVAAASPPPARQLRSLLSREGGGCIRRPRPAPQLASAPSPSRSHRIPREHRLRACRDPPCPRLLSQLRPRAAMSAVAAGNKKSAPARWLTAFRGAVHGRSRTALRFPVIRDDPELSAPLLGVWP
jgi:hypothetical protein